MTKFTINLDGEDTEIEVTRQGNHLHVTYNGSTAELELIHTDGADLLLEQILADGSRQRIRAAGHTDFPRVKAPLRGGASFSSTPQNGVPTSKGVDAEEGRNRAWETGTSQIIK